MNRNQPSMRVLRHFIWDFDGTLFDTYPIIVQNLRDALAQFGRDAAPGEIMRYMLTTIPAACAHYAEAFGIPREELSRAYVQRHRQATLELAARPMPGVEPVLRAIRESGRYNYIFTHRSVDETMAYLDKYGLSREFCEVVAPETPGFSLKPAPDAVLYLARKYGMTGDDAVMVGDREIDLGSGRAAGIRTAHLVCAAAPETLESDWTFSDYRQMLVLL